MLLFKQFPDKSVIAPFLTCGQLYHGIKFKPHDRELEFLGIVIYAFIVGRLE
jgi:hypothetical protein